MKRKQFTFYRSFLEAMRKLPEEMWLAYLVNIITYGLDGETTMKMNFTQEAMFELVKPNLDTSRKRAAAGKAGHFVETSCSNKGEKENEKETEIEVKKENEIEIKIERECSARAEFERFWDLYPMKIGKEDAWEAWQRKMPDVDTACENLRFWVRSKQWTKDGSHFIPRAAKFLEQEYYLQTPEGTQKGVYGHLGKAELEAIENLMREDFT